MIHVTRPATQGGLCLGLAVLLLGALTAAHAGAVYKCQGPGGQVAITNKPQEYAGCTKVPGTDYADAPKAVAKAPPKPVPAAAPASNASASNPSASNPSASSAPASTAAAVPPASALASAPGASVASAVPVAPSATSPGAHGTYQSALPSRFANVVSVVSLNGVVQKATTQNATERPDKDTEIRRGAVYKVARANGITEYTNVRPAGTSYQLLFTYIATCYACALNSAVDFATVALNLDIYRTEVAMAAAEFGVDPALLRAVMHAESAFNPNAISHAGAQGLMQLMPATATDVGVSNPFEPLQNIRGGARYLSLLLARFNGDERLATAAYNAGPLSVEKYNGVPPYDETRVYVERVATLRKRYGAAR